WLDGRLASTGKRLLLGSIGLAGLLLLVLVGPYPVSMITSAADEISNSSPTRITMAFLGMLQAGLVLSLEKPLTALLARPRLWFVTVVVNQRIMTWFLWHLTVDRKSTRLNSSHVSISYAVFCLKKKNRPLTCSTAVS